VLLASLALALFVALSPSLVYAPAPRIVLYLLVALIPAILFAAELTAHFQLQLGWFVASAGGAAAFVLITLVVLVHLTKPEQQIAVFEIVDANGQAVGGLDVPGAVQVPRTPNGLTVTPLVDGNSVVLIFPEQAPEVELRVQPAHRGPVYGSKVSYAGSRTTRLRLGHELKIGG
jgi:uncharacterized membrane protein